VAYNNPPHVFVREGSLVRIRDVDGIIRIEPLSETALRGVLARAANFVEMSEKGPGRDADPPMKVVKDNTSNDFMAEYTAYHRSCRESSGSS
jgi:hypothetical protein